MTKNISKFISAIGKIICFVVPFISKTLYPSIKKIANDPDLQPIEKIGLILFFIIFEFIPFLNLHAQTKESESDEPAGKAA